MNESPTTETAPPGIDNVSDTALWVAVYRAQESKRADALFQDPLAERLAGERGRKIAERMFGSRYTAWSLAIRTYVIDDFIRRLVDKGPAGDGRDLVDTVVNLGAGLDTRPYRLNLPASLRWIEADYAPMIARKSELLHDETPTCRLERVAIDLGNDRARTEFLAGLAARGGRILVLTEGVIPYLTEDQVGALAKDLRTHPEFRFWIVDYFAPQVVRYMRSKRRRAQMRNAPFRFFPSDWRGFFARHGWRPGETRYLAEESIKLGRRVPGPWWARILLALMPESARRKQRKFLAYVLLEPSVEATTPVAVD